MNAIRPFKRHRLEQPGPYQHIASDRQLGCGCWMIQLGRNRAANIRRSVVVRGLKYGWLWDPQSWKHLLRYDLLEVHVFRSDPLLCRLSMRPTSQGNVRFSPPTIVHSKPSCESNQQLYVPRQRYADNLFEMRRSLNHAQHHQRLVQIPLSACLVALLLFSGDLLE